MFLELLKSDLQQFREWLALERPPEASALFNVALEKVKHATLRTRAKLAAIKASGDRVNPDEELRNLWELASDALKAVDTGLSRRCFQKADYWADPSRWTRDEIDAAGISLDSIFADICAQLETPHRRTATTRGQLSLDDAAVGIITALPKEHAAILEVFECSSSVPIASGSGMFYHLAKIRTEFGGDIVVVISSLVEMGNNMAAIYAANMANDCRLVKHIVMVGIAGAVPKPDDAEHHVRLGDIVVSDIHGVVQFDLGKDDEINGFEYRGSASRPSAILLAAVRSLQALAELGNRPWEVRIARLIEKHAEWERPPEAADVLKDIGEEVVHPIDGDRRTGRPRVFLGPIASSNILLKNSAYRDKLRSAYKIKAVEMEASGIADAAWRASRGYLIVRGTCDYCNKGKNNIWQRYAALIAACFARSVIEFTPPDPGAAGRPALSENIRKQVDQMDRGLDFSTMTKSVPAPQRQQFRTEPMVPSIKADFREPKDVAPGISPKAGVIAAIQSRLENELAGIPAAKLDESPASPTADRAKGDVPPPQTHAALDDGVTIPGISDVSLILEKGYNFLARISAALKVAEIERALSSGQDLERWLPSHEHLLTPDLKARIFIELSNLAVVKARLDAPPGSMPDMSTAMRYLARARHVQK